MEKAAVITIKTVQTGGDGEPDVIEFSSDGMYSYENGIAEAMYYESEVTGLTGTRTKVRVSNGRVEVKHEGLIMSEMVFQVGERAKFLYETPYGKTNIGIDTHSVASDLDSEGGDVAVKYALNFDHSYAVLNRFSMHVEIIN